MNEAETRAELIDPQLRACGWGVVEDSKVFREYPITAGRIQSGGIREKKQIADYVLAYKGIKLAVIEAKSSDLEVGEGVAQAKLYAEKLCLETTYASNGKEIYSICLKTGAEGLVANYLTPDELWHKTFAIQSIWREKFSAVPFEDKGGSWQPRYYQEIAVNRTLAAIADNQQRILLTLATGTGKTAIAFQIAWKLFKARWNLRWNGSRQPRILFLADRNILANQAYNAFSAFDEDALVRISPKEIIKKAGVPTNGNIFFTIFQTFMTGRDLDGHPSPYFGAYPADYFDLIIIDECHRGGAKDDGNWRAILEYFAPAVQLGLTATPKRKDNTDTYRYFGEPVYMYSLKDGINDGFLTPFKVKRIKTTLDDYIYTSDDLVVEGAIETGKCYTELDFNRIIEIKEREAKRIKIFMDEADPDEKALIFCATQEHAAVIRDLINQFKVNKHPNYCVRVTANDGEIGEQFLREFQDNEKTIPTILTTSQKLSTGVDAPNVRSIVLLRPINSMLEFKQIIGRGTRLFEGKIFFTIYDFVDAYKHFTDREWDGEPLEPDLPRPSPKSRLNTDEVNLFSEVNEGDNIVAEKRQLVKIQLKDGKSREIQYLLATSFWSAEGKPISAEEFLNNLFGALPSFFTSEEELRDLWGNPATRKNLLEKLADIGYGIAELNILQKLIDAEKSDLFDVLEYVFNSDKTPITRSDRVVMAKLKLHLLLDERQKEFINFVLDKYIESGVEELAQEKLPLLLINKYHSLADATNILGEVSQISALFINFQQYLYQPPAILTRTTC